MFCKIIALALFATSINSSVIATQSEGSESTENYTSDTASENTTISIFVCHHKQFPICKSDVLVPIHIGKENSQVDLGLIGDNTGDHISSKNPYFCELTGMYWIWKNVKADIVGLCHYRRYFNFKNDHTVVNKIDQDFAEWSGNTLEEIKPYFKTYDIILPEKTGERKIPLYDRYIQEHIQSDLDMALDIIKEKYPNQYQIACNTLHSSRVGYHYNMLITKKEIFDAYAQWLFDILFELEKRIQKDVLKRDAYQQRAYGLLSERLMNVWIALHPELKIKELPVIFVEEDKLVWIVYLFRYWKRRCFNFFSGRKP